MIANNNWRLKGVRRIYYNKRRYTNILKELKEILENPKSKLNIIPRQDKAIEFSTDYCLRDLGFTDKDIKEEFKKS